MGGWVAGWPGGWVAGLSGNIAISAFNWVEVEIEAELGNISRNEAALWPNAYSKLWRTFNQSEEPYPIFTWLYKSQPEQQN